MYRLFPSSKDFSPGWSGFGGLSSSDLVFSWNERKQLSGDDTQIGAQLWKAYASGDTESLRQLSTCNSEAFQLLPEVVAAHLERLHCADKLPRPQETLLEIVKKGRKTFPDIFQEFSRREGVYGFGDAQVRAMLDEMNIDY